MMVSWLLIKTCGRIKKLCSVLEVRGWRTDIKIVVLNRLERKNRCQYLTYRAINWANINPLEGSIAVNKQYEARNAATGISSWSILCGARKCIK